MTRKGSGVQIPYGPPRSPGQKLAGQDFCALTILAARRRSCDASSATSSSASRERELMTTNDDLLEIQNLLARYCLYLDLDDVDGWVGLFTPDAVYRVYGRDFVGEEGLRAMSEGAPGGLHLGGPPVIELDGDRATTVRNLLFVERTTGEQRNAVYNDDLVRTADGWRIARCRCRFIVADGLADRPARKES